MRYPPEHRQATHRKVVHVASRRFRREGIDAVGVASLMKDAGLTHGGFYGHFDSKDALVAEAAAAAFDEMVPHYRDRIAEAPPGERLRALVRAYLSPSHRDHPGHGCPMAALAGELARQPPAVREAASAGLRHLQSAIADAARDDGVEVDAGALLALMVGALALSRVPTDPAASARWLDGALAAVDRLVVAKPPAARRRR